MAKSKLSAPRSRNAKRALSPPPPELSNIRRPDADDIPAKEKLTQKIAVLGVRGDQGISKAKSKSKRMSTKQRRRAEGAREKAEAAIEKLERKKQDSKQRGEVIKKRRGDWEELNDKVRMELEMEREAAVVKDGKVPVA